MTFRRWCALLFGISHSRAMVIVGTGRACRASRSRTSRRRSADLTVLDDMRSGMPDARRASELSATDVTELPQVPGAQEVSRRPDSGRWRRVSALTDGDGPTSIYRCGQTRLIALDRQRLRPDGSRISLGSEASATRVATMAGPRSEAEQRAPRSEVAGSSRRSLAGAG